MGYLQQKAKLGMDLLVFQFPLWDTIIAPYIVKNKELDPFNSLYGILVVGLIIGSLVVALSIPFMGYKKKASIIVAYQKSLSIPFMGYPLNVAVSSIFIVINFQFPLWDTALNSNTIHLFKNAFNSLYGIHIRNISGIPSKTSLSIPFMGYCIT